MSDLYPSNMKAAAFRHLIAGERLYGGDRKDVAGYLFGWASECALKALMIESGMKPLEKVYRRDDPFYAHLERLKTLLRDQAKGRRQADIRKYAADVSFMQFWETAMRYSDGKCIDVRWINRWNSNAKAVVGELS